MSPSKTDRVRNIIARIRYLLAGFFKKSSEVLKMSHHNWQWISRGALLSIVLFSIGFLIFMASSLSMLWLIIFALFIFLSMLLIGAGIRFGLRILGLIPRYASWFIFASIALVFMFFYAPFAGMILILLYLVLTFIFIAGSLSNFIGGTWGNLSRGKQILNVLFFTGGIVNLILMIFFLVSPGPKKDAIENFAIQSSIQPEQIKLDDPSEQGLNEIKSLNYGTGYDKHRKEFGSETDVISSSVDASSFIDGWDGFTGKIRTRYWGFDCDSLPLNGRAWYPEGEGPFPIVMMVHGNHLDRDYSDMGYEYLGKHFASHGVLSISVDENFINSGLLEFGNGLSEENDARAWLLLKHLEQLKRWNSDSTSAFYQKADLDNVVLIGHSRGGEAVNIASCFNTLPYYPDNAKEKFDFNFGIRGIISIAQVDGQYTPANIPTPVENVNFLALHGSLDADMESFHGLRQMNRIKYSDSLYHFKTGLFIHGANHGQFNTSWGKNDIGYPNGLLLDRRNMLSKEEQEKIALVYMTAFLKVNFGFDSAYIDLFKDYRSGISWLPETVYLNQFEDSRQNIFCDFEEDIDLTTGSVEELSCCFQDLSKVREQHINLRDGKQGTRALILGWNNENDSIPGSYQLVFKDSGAYNFQTYENIVFATAALEEDPGDRAGVEDEKSEDSETESDVEEFVEETIMEVEEDVEEKEKPLEFTIQLNDIYGESASLDLGDYFLIQPPITPQIYKRKIFSDGPGPEIIPQYVMLKLSDFHQKNPELDMQQIHSISFIFDQTEKGVILLDNIGLSNSFPN